MTLAVYNVRSFVSACLDSLLSQTYADFELIIVDDASSDGTPDLLHAYSNRDARIQLITKQVNEGLAVARNDALAAARGEFVLFLDGDDLYDSSLLQEAIDTADREDADLVMWDYVVFDDPASIPERRRHASTLACLDPADQAALLARPAFAWTKMVRRDMMLQLGGGFPPGLTYQDVPVHWRLITQAEKVALIPRRLAYYRQQPAATTAGRSMRRADYFAILDIVYEDLVERGIYDRYCDIFISLQLNAWHGVYDVVEKPHRPAILQIIKARLTSQHMAFVASKKPMRWRARQFYKALDGSLTARVRLSAWVLTRSVKRILSSRVRPPRGSA